MVEKYDMPPSRLIDIKNITGKQVFDLNQPHTKIGRSAPNDIIILKNTISGKHALIEFKDDAFYLSDLGSTNKTQLNGKVLEPHTPAQVRDSDEITLDVYKFVFVVEEPEPAAPPEPEEPIEDAIGDALGNREASPALSLDTTQKRMIGRYEASTKLGKGGFGSVWKAKDPKGETVAIKLLNPENLKDERAVRKFFHEAIILSHLTHPNITRFIDFFPKDKNYAIVMDFIEGSDIKALLLKHKGPLPFDTACKIAHQTLDTFQFAHEKGILHRDIKPENIMLDTEGNVKIMDFGIAKMSSAETQKTAFTMISPLYTPPERFDHSSEVTVRSDIYALGIVFYEIFTGKHPIDATSPSKIIYAHLNQLFDPPDQIAAVPPAMSRAILKALEKDPEERFQNFAEFKQHMLSDNGQATVEQAVKPVTPPVSEYDPPSLSIHGDTPGSALPPAAGRIEFSPAYFKVGVAVLNYFTDTLKKHLENGTTFSIAQAGDTLTLVLETAEGDRKIVEKDLHKILAASRLKGQA
jgi:serine/threonine protein kinase